MLIQWKIWKRYTRKTKDWDYKYITVLKDWEFKLISEVKWVF